MAYYKFEQGQKMPIDSYFYACPNNGQCAQIKWEEYGFIWKPVWVDETGAKRRDGIPYGKGYIHPTEFDYSPEQLKSIDPTVHSAIGFKCCTFCHKPVSAFEAIDLNKKLGYELPTVDDLLGSITKLPSLAELLEGL